MKKENTRISRLTYHLFTVAMYVLIIICLLSSYRIYSIQKEYKSGIVSYRNIEAKADTNQIEKGKNVSFDSRTINFSELKAINKDIVGWIYSEGTPINYPIVRGNDNDYYLSHLFDGTYNRAGCIFLDYRNNMDFSDMNNIVYGHYMRNGTMFSSILKYKNQKYYEEHKEIILITETDSYVIEIFAGYVTNVQDDAWNIHFQNLDEHEAWITKAINSSCFESNVDINQNDRIITFSTCSYEFENARFVLLGRIR